MNILVYPHQLVIGGSQINALELAARVRDQGHNVLIVAPEGVLVDMIRDLKLSYIPTKTSADHASFTTANQLMGIVRQHKIDLVHAYEWRPAMEASFGPHLFGVPLVVTVLSMNVSNFIPRHLPLIVGTRELAEASAARGVKEVHVMEPPIDMSLNQTQDRPGSRARWSFSANETVVAVICRLTTDLEKLEGVLEAIQVIGRLAAAFPLRFLVVGGGEGLAEVTEAAAAVNMRLGSDVIVVEGPMTDPRSAYEAADIVVGMGSSALRAMAFEKPLVVQGTDGFWKMLDQATLPTFLRQGWFGSGGGGAVDLEAILRSLLADPARWGQLGTFGRAVVAEHFDIDVAAQNLIAIYQRALAAKSAKERWLLSMSRSAASFAKWCAFGALRSARGRTAL